MSFLYYVYFYVYAHGILQMYVNCNLKQLIFAKKNNLYQRAFIILTKKESIS
ncbi:hypothetical protein SAMN05444671_0170 [Flavobacterium sp. CF108]|nr:hypothetical protein SAMN04487978_3302 [Flavobacterium sp. fv08]SHI06350.1 hypothetical protein SAMN05444671_0170 [Flavobacterium sp. CF108]